MAGKLIIVGLGPGEPAQVPGAVLAALAGADRIFLRTARHPATALLTAQRLEWESFDYFYEQEANCKELYRRIADTLIQEGADKRLAYAVPGHPLVYEPSVNLLLEKAPVAGLETEIIPAISCLDALFSTLKLNTGQGVIIAEAHAFDAAGLDPGLGLLLIRVYNRQVAASIRASLKAFYPADHPVAVVHRAGLPGWERVETVPLETIEGLPWADYPASIYLKPYPEGRERILPGLTAIMARLRGEKGCPWDREQTHQSLQRYLVEETYEVLEAIEAEDMNKLCEELGDLLLQVVFHARLAEEKGNFIMADCLQAICTKMRRRHPHVFGSASINTAGEVLQRWDKIKAAEKKDNGVNYPSALSVPRGLPALLKALKVQEQAARAGFDWPEFNGVWAKIGEEMEELEAAIVAGQRQEQIDEIGDLLFSVVNLARWLKIEPETSLQAAVDKFSTRFNYLENKARQKGRQVEEFSLEELDVLWQKAKKVSEK